LYCENMFIIFEFIMTKICLNNIKKNNLKFISQKVIILFNIIFKPSTAIMTKLKINADNLMFMRMGKPMKLFLKIGRMKEVGFQKKEKEVPISKEMFKAINEIAEATRKTRILEIMKI
jgi:hypothetical protein